MATASSAGFLARQQSYALLVQKVSEGKTLTPSEITAMTRFEDELSRSGIDIPDQFVAISEVEEYSGYKARTIYKAVNDGELIRQADKSFARDDVDRWLKSKGRRPVVRKDAGSDDHLSEDEGEDNDDAMFSSRKEEARYRHFRAKREELIVKQLEGELLPRAVVEKMLADRAHEFATAIMLLKRAIGHRIAAVSGLDNHEVDAIIDEEGRALLTVMSRKVVLHVD